MRFMGLVGVVAATIGAVSPAHATVRVDIDLTHQRMHVQAREGNFDWAISSARSGFFTPGGSFAPTHLERMHFSKKYHMSPMPHAIFFRGGYAIHGTSSTGQLGRPASHGCVRLSPGHAAALYKMVQTEGARISISGSPPPSRFVAERETPRRISRHVARRDGDLGASADADRTSRRRTPRIIGYVYQTPYGIIPAGAATAGPFYALPPD